MRIGFWSLIGIGSLIAASQSFADDDADAAFFESKVRPLLLARCTECHGSEKPKAGLRLDSREAILSGGESGAAAIAGKPDESLLIDAIGYRNSVQMPPKSKLSDAEIAILTEWVRRGLPWPNSSPTTSTPAPSTAAPSDYSDEQKSFWAFQPVQHSIPPLSGNPAWSRSAIDEFIWQGLESKGLTSAREADRRTLFRRVVIDLTGLIPSPQEMDDFLADMNADALERVVDRLLASPRYGERWARRWLDVARYADSNGLDENLAYANAYRYRDYVVKSMRDDKPYDRFLIEQIAGDLLYAEEENRSSSSDQAQSDQFDPLIATGFLSLGAKMLAEDDPIKMQMDIIDEQVDTIGRAVLGLTMGCARCHDHKFDPLSAEDYYGLAGIFKSTQTMDTFTVVARWHERPLATSSQVKDLNDRQNLIAAAKKEIESKKSAATTDYLNAARRHSGAYLLAATYDMKLAEQLVAAAPRGNSPDPRSIPGAILIEAEDFARGNVRKDLESYGKGIGVLVNRGETPNFTEYDVDIEKQDDYQLELRYAAAGARPVKLSVNGYLVTPNAANQVTGSWNPDGQKWFVESFVTLNSGRNVIRLEQPGAFPHIDKLLMTPVELPKNEFAIPASSASQSESPRLLPSITLQWRKALEASRSEAGSLLTAWHQFLQDNRLTVDPNQGNNGIARLQGETAPTSFGELAARYERLFEEAQAAATQRAESGDPKSPLADPVLEAAYQLITDSKGPFAIPSDIESVFPNTVAAELKSMRDDLAAKESNLPKYVEVMSVSDAKPENLKIHLRGSHLTLGREVPRQLPRILAMSGDRKLNEGSGRLELARWLANPKHQLTSRVMVNRLWQWHFGHGLVRSPDNFGRLGERPSHPELLDWLASEFATMGADGSSPHPKAFSLKAMHRRLIATSVYQQSTAYNEPATLIDPENRLLWRFNRQRMDVEVLRDSLLLLSDQLDEVPGGTLLPTANRAYVTSTANVNPAIYTSHRRAIYLPVVRSALYEVFTAFDFADPSTLAGQRDQTTVAPQALFMMNSSFVLEQVGAVANQLQEQVNLDQPARIQTLYRLALGRSAASSEVDRATDYLTRYAKAMSQPDTDLRTAEKNAWTSLCRAVVSTNEFIYVD